MKRFVSMSLTACVLVAVAAGCASRQARETTPPPQDMGVAEKADYRTRETIMRVTDRETTGFEFERGGATLSENARRELTAFVAQARQDRPFEAVTVAVWPDIAISEGDEEVEAQQQLVQSRGEAIENFLKEDLQVENVQVYNMAEPNELGRALVQGGGGERAPASEDVLKDFRERARLGWAIVTVKPVESPGLLESL